MAGGANAVYRSADDAARIARTLAGWVQTADGWALPILPAQNAQRRAGPCLYAAKQRIRPVKTLQTSANEATPSLMPCATNPGSTAERSLPCVCLG